MSTTLARFTVKVDDGEPQTVVANRLDYIMAERTSGKPVARAAEEGYLEPLLRIAYEASNRCRVIPDGMGFDAFIERCDVEYVTDDEETADSGNE